MTPNRGELVEIEFEMGRLRRLAMGLLAVVIAASIVGCTHGTSEHDAGQASAVTGVNGGQASGGTEPLLALGQQVYARECASCHGAQGEGEPDWGVAREDGSLPAPPHDSSGHTWHHSDADLLEIIAYGGGIHTANSRMPGFREKLSDREIWAVLKHIKTMWGPSERAYQEDRTEDWTLMMKEAGATHAP